MKYHKLIFILGCFFTLFTSYAQIPFSVGGTQADQVSEIDKDNDLNIYVAYNINGTATFGTKTYTSKGKQDMVFAKYSSLGAYVWHYGLGGTDDDKINAIETDTEGNIYIGGYFTGRLDVDLTSAVKEIVSAGKKDGFVAKYDKTGKLLWAFPLGAKEDDEIFDMKLDSRGSIYLAGRYQEEIDFDPTTTARRVKSKGRTDWFLVKYKEDGTLQWVNGIGGVLDDWREGSAASVAVDGTGSCYLYGTFLGQGSFNPQGSSVIINGSDSLNAFLGKYYSDGRMEWVNSFPSKFTTYIPKNGIAIDYANDVAITGTFSGTIDTDASSSQLILNSRGKQDVFLAKYSSVGRLRWAVSGGGFENDMGLGLQVSLQGNFSLIGSFEKAAEFRTGANVVNFESQSFKGTKDAFIAHFDNFGAVKWGKNYGKNNTTSKNTIPQALTIDGGGNSILAGTFFDTLAVSPQNNFISKGNTDVFVIKLDKDGAIYVVKNCVDRPSAGEVMGDTTICIGQVSRLKLFKPSEAVGLQVQWQVSTDQKNYTNIGEATNSTEIITPELYKNSYVRAIMRCLESKKADTSRVRRILISDLEVNAGSPQVIKVGDVITLGGLPVAKKGIGKYKYSWTPRSVLDNPTAANPTFRALFEGEYTFTVSVSDSICTASQSVQVVVNPIVGVEADPNFYQFKAYPNPASDKLDINYFLPNSTFTKIRLLNLSGKTVREFEAYQRAGNQNLMFDLKNLPQGLYFYDFRTEEHFFARKFLILK